MRKFENIYGVKETDLALLCENEHGEHAWIPKSHIDDDSEVWEEGHEGCLVVSRWIAERIEFR